MSTNAAVLSQENAPARRAANLALWALQLGGAFMFAMAGYNKLSGNPMMIGLFDAIGIGQWFRYVTGALELGSAVLLLIPAFSGIGAALLVGTMIGALVTHFTIIGGSVAVPGALLIAMVLVAYGRRDRTLRLLGRE